MANQREAAETIALKALTWIAGHENLLDVFMGATGAGRDDLLAGAQDPDFLASLLDFLLMDDAWIMEFSEAANVPPAAVVEARAALPGGVQTHWT
ncbi:MULTISPECIES: DUF3572 domain-containing protein [Roseovarius]|uniref:DUF3572 domain-containing protein n=1 Tax=Roseovarius TaxID=74030 RepID=UPI001C93EF5A|nr:DUF3572 domain-containing protein [Roseovarius atlanticus]MBY5987930.1 DUF3572 domain-containing protein [Roseovarius atlanticus]MBY6123321.1 DUF3572 domain-containing protein [Roseovarius atlanticus]MBY6147816.1 DUF3572 domain-containing protein [Roseovarius atlanticus]